MAESSPATPRVKSSWRQIIAFVLAPLCAALPALVSSKWAILGLLATQLLLGFAWRLFSADEKASAKSKPCNLICD